MFKNMRQRGPTATAISPGLYLDKHPASSITPETPMVDNGTNSDTQSGIYNNESTNMTTLSPSISPMHSGNKINGYVTTPKIPRSDCNSKITNQKPTFGVSSHIDASKSVGRYLSHRKLRKKGKREIRFQQLNGDSAQNLHSLKVTIRRTYKSNKADTGMCTIVNTSQNHSSKMDSADISSDPIPLPITNDATQSVCVNNAVLVNKMECNHQNENACNKVDVVTSTLDSATLTEPDLLGPCEPGTKLVVEGVVWLESPGMLVLSMQWRGRNYVGTLLDAPKQSFAPTCTDKGVISALSLLRGRKPWSYGSPGGYRTRGVHHYHHHCRPYHHRRRGGPNVGFGVVGSITTRSATAAAAAATTKTDVNLTDEPAWKSSRSPSVDDQYVDSYSNEPLQTSGDTMNSNAAVDNTSKLHRGIKGRRRRGAGRRLLLTETASSELETPLDTSTDVKEVDDFVNEENSVEKPSADPPLRCPFQNCEKRFSDILSMRYHFTLGHSAQANTFEHVSDPSLTSSCKVMSPSTTTYSQTQDHCESTTSSPPKLARSNSNKDRDGDSNETSFLTINADDVDNLDPPKLQRVVSIQDSYIGGLQSSENVPSKHNILTRSPDMPDEPPAPSPAYSDISDDGAEIPRTPVSILNDRSTMVNEPQYARSPSLVTHRTEQAATTRPCIDLTNGLRFSPVILSSPSAVTLIDGCDPNKLYFNPSGLLSTNVKAVSGLIYQNARSPLRDDLQRPTSNLSTSSNCEEGRLCTLRPLQRPLNLSPVNLNTEDLRNLTSPNLPGNIPPASLYNNMQVIPTLHPPQSSGVIKDGTPPPTALVISGCAAPQNPHMRLHKSESCD